MVSGFLSRGNLRGLEVAFEPPGELYVGEPATLAFRLRTRGRWLGRRLLEATGPSGSSAALVPYLPPRREHRLTVDLVPRRRGRLPVPYLHLASIYPLGLFRKGLRYPVAGELLVYPAILPAAELRLAGVAAGDERRMRKVGRGHELFSLRGFRRGDDPRGIHWKQSARTGSLVYLEREAEEGKRLTVVLDNGVAPLAGAAAERRFETLVSRAASAAHHHLSRGWEVELRLRDGGVGYGRGRSHRLRILEALALVEPVAAAGAPAGADRPQRRLHGLRHGRRRGAAGRRGMKKAPPPLGFAREKRLLLGALAFFTPLPLAFNEVTGWLQLAIYWLVVGLFLLRAWRGEDGWLPYWAMNVLAVLYLPLLALDLSVVWRGRVLQPLVHLVLFALAVKLWGLHREKEKWHALLAIFFLFVAAMGTSVHPSVLAYFVVELGLTLLLLSRLTAAHLLERHGRPGTSTAVVPMRGFVVPGVIWTVALAVPLFAILPRFQNPYISVVGPGGSGVNAIAALRDRLDLDSIGRSRNDRAVVMRLDYQAPPPPAHEARFKAAVYDRFEDNSWRREPAGFEPVRRSPGGGFGLAAAPVRSWVKIWLQPQRRADLVLPVDAAVIEVAATRVAVQASGVVALPVPPPTTLEFRAGLGERPLLPDLAAGAATAAEADGDSVPPRIRALAAEVMGAGDDAERALRAETHLRQEFAYTLDRMDSPSADPLDDFLFRDRAGHCELFASSLVLMLRSQGIPARLVTGYLGTEYNPLEGYHIVRGANAHAWVEALVGEGGWRILDPTPASGLPRAAEPGPDGPDAAGLGLSRVPLGPLRHLVRLLRPGAGLLRPALAVARTCAACSSAASRGPTWPVRLSPKRRPSRSRRRSSPATAHRCRPGCRCWRCWSRRSSGGVSAAGSSPQPAPIFACVGVCAPSTRRSARRWRRWHWRGASATASLRRRLRPAPWWASICARALGASGSGRKSCSARACS